METISSKTEKGVGASRSKPKENLDGLRFPDEKGKGSPDDLRIHELIAQLLDLDKPEQSQKYTELFELIRDRASLNLDGVLRRYSGSVKSKALGLVFNLVEKSSIQSLLLQNSAIDSETLGWALTASGGLGGQHKLRKLKTLHLSNNRLGTRPFSAGAIVAGASGVDSLASALGKGWLPALQELRLSSNDVECSGFQALATAFKTGNVTSLRILDLGNNEMSTARAYDAHLALADAMESGSLSALEELRLPGCGLDSDCCKAYAAAMCSGHLSALKAVDFNTNWIGRVGAQSLVEAMTFKGLNNAMREIDFSGNYNVGNYLATIRFPVLHVLRLRETALERGTLALPESLEILDLSSNLVPELAESLLRGNCRQLKELNLDNTGMGAHGLRKLGEAFENIEKDHFQSLEVLNLSFNYFGDTAVSRFGKKLCGCHLTQLRELHLKSTGMGDEGLKEIAKASEGGHLQSLEVLDVSDNWSIGDMGVLALAASLQSGRSSHLKKLHLSSTMVGDEGLVGIAEAAALGDLKSLEVDVRRTHCTRECKGISSVDRNYQLTYKDYRLTFDSTEEGPSERILESGLGGLPGERSSDKDQSHQDSAIYPSSMVISQEQDLDRTQIVDLTVDPGQVQKPPELPAAAENVRGNINNPDLSEEKIREEDSEIDEISSHEDFDDESLQTMESNVFEVTKEASPTDIVPGQQLLEHHGGAENAGFDFSGCVQVPGKSEEDLLLEFISKEVKDGRGGEMYCLDAEWMKERSTEYRDKIQVIFQDAGYYETIITDTEIYYESLFHGGFDVHASISSRSRQLNDNQVSDSKEGVDFKQLSSSGASTQIPSTSDPSAQLLEAGDGQKAKVSKSDAGISKEELEVEGSCAHDCQPVLLKVRNEPHDQSQRSSNSQGEETQQELLKMCDVYFSTQEKWKLPKKSKNTQVKFHVQITLSCCVERGQLCIKLPYMTGQIIDTEDTKSIVMKEMRVTLSASVDNHPSSLAVKNFQDEKDPQVVKHARADAEYVYTESGGYTKSVRIEPILSVTTGGVAAAAGSISIDPGQEIKHVICREGQKLDLVILRSGDTACANPDMQRSQVLVLQRNVRNTWLTGQDSEKTSVGIRSGDPKDTVKLIGNIDASNGNGVLPLKITCCVELLIAHIDALEEKGKKTENTILKALIEKVRWTDKRIQFPTCGHAVFEGEYVKSTLPITPHSS